MYKFVVSIDPDLFLESFFDLHKEHKSVLEIYDKTELVDSVVNASVSIYSQSLTDEQDNIFDSRVCDVLAYPSKEFDKYYSAVHSLNKYYQQRLMTDFSFTDVKKIGSNLYEYII